MRASRKPCPHSVAWRTHLSCYCQFSLDEFDWFSLLFLFENNNRPVFFRTVETYRSPVETICTNIDYYIPDNKGDTKSFSEDAMARLRKISPTTQRGRQLLTECLIFVFVFSDMGRAMIALFIVSFFFDFVAFWTGVVGCWRRGAGNITSTAILMLLACKCLVAAHYYYRFFLFPALVWPSFVPEWFVSLSSCKTRWCNFSVGCSSDFNHKSCCVALVFRLDGQEEEKV